MFGKMKLSTLLNLGFGLLLCLMVFISYVAFSSLQRANDSFTEYRSLARETNLAGRLQANMVLVRLYVKEFFKSGRQQSLTNYESRLKKLQTFLTQAKTEITQKARARDIAVIDESLNTYISQFQRIVEFKILRDELVFNQLDPSGLAMRTRLTDIMTSAFTDKDAEAAYYAGRIQEHVLLARLYANKYLNTNEQAAANRFQQEIGLAIDTEANTLRLVLDDPRRKALFAEFMEERKKYRRIFSQVKQLIEQRNEIISLQLDTIGPVISDAAENVKLSVKDDQDKLGPELAIQNEKSVQLIMLVSALGILTATLLSWLIARKIRQPIGGEPLMIMDITRNLAAGDTNISVDLSNKNPEGILASVLEMAETLNQKARMAEEIAAGNLDTELVLASDKDVLGKALITMVRQLQSRSADIQKENEAKASLLEKMEQQDWLKSNIASLFQLAQSMDTPDRLATCVLSRLAEVINVGHGAFYVLDKESSVYTLVGSYAYTTRKNLANRFRPGESLIGQCALEQKYILLTQVPDDYIAISSGLGESKPLNIIAYPIIFNTDCIAVIELATFTPLPPLETELVSQICGNLGVVINNLISREKVESLLTASEANQAELKSQSDALQTQQEELKLANENLQQQQEELRCANESLQEQTELLQDSEKKLRKSNQELEDKQTSLQQQKTEIETAQAELTLKARELSVASKYKSEFLANMSHELRTPLNSLLILSKSLMDNREGNLTDKQLKSARVIFEGGNSLLEMINDILDLSKVEAGKLEINIAETNLQQLCQQITAMFEQEAASKALKFETHISDDAPQTIESDSHRLEQILRNFLSNAFKFTEKGSVTLNITSSGIDEIPHIAFAVTDTGIGIDANKTEQIFEAFQQQDGSISRKYGGTGLGLTISRELARLLGGEIQVTSTPGEGSTFTLIVPLHFQQTESPTTEEGNKVSALSQIIQSHQQTALARTPPASENMLLIVEDDQTFASTLADIAREHGFDPVQTSSGREALYLAMEYQPGAILLDIGLPDISGIEVIDQLKHHPITRHIKVHVVSATDHQKEADEHGADSFSLKPLSAESIGKTLIELRESHQLQPARILLVEDDQAERIALETLLGEQGTDMVFAESGDVACEILREQAPFDCIILDLGLPGMSGIDMLEYLNSQPQLQQIPVIVYTGRELSAEQQEKINSYANDIIIKGAASPDRLLDDIRLFMNSIHTETPMAEYQQDTLLKGRKILLVDDDIRNTYALSSQLEQEEIKVEIADSGIHALEILEQQEDIELVLMDIMMPEMDGLEATRQIRQMPEYEDIPIIALTAKAMPEDKVACLEAGASEYLAKPVNMDRLLSMLKVWLYRAT